jgi:Uma2 family endonuclease
MNPQSMSAAYPPKPPPKGEDLPYSDGVPMETYQHHMQMTLLLQSLHHAFAGRRDYFAAGNMFFYFSETQSRRNDFLGPDFFVVLDTHDRPRRSWVTWEEDGRLPAVVIELTSPSTEANDRGKKKDLYARVLRVPFYAIFDPISGRFDAYRLDPGARAYVEVKPDENGRVHCFPLGLWLGVVHGTEFGEGTPWLRFFDEAGQLVPSPDERAMAESERANAEALRAASESARAASESARADAAEAELRRLREELARRG